MFISHIYTYIYIYIYIYASLARGSGLDFSLFTPSSSSSSHSSLELHDTQVCSAPQRIARGGPFSTAAITTERATEGFSARL